MLYTIVIYLIIYLIVLLSAYQSKVTSLRRGCSINRSVAFYVGVMFFAILIGLRWNIGVDYENYYNLIIGNYKYDIEFERLELIPRMLMKAIRTFNLPFYFWFIIMAFMQLFFMEQVFKKDLRPFIVWAVFLYLAMELDFLMNVVRQANAITICMYSYTFIKDRKFKKFIFWIIIASLFHVSALICIPLYWIILFKIRFRPIYQAFIIIISLLLGSSLITNLVSSLFSLSEGMLYINDKLQSVEEQLHIVQAGSGLGVIYYYARYFILIFYSPKLSKEYKEFGFDIYYSIGFIGMCLYKATMADMLLSRVVSYFTIANIICIAMFFVYLYRKKKTTIECLIFMFLLLGQFAIIMSSIIGSTTWRFVWNA